MFEPRLSHLPLRTIVIDIERNEVEMLSVAQGLHVQKDWTFDMSVLAPFAVHSQLQTSRILLEDHYAPSWLLEERWPCSGYQTVARAGSCSMEAFAAEASRISNLLVPGGTETTTPFEEYWAQFECGDSTAAVICWEYTIQRHRRSTSTSIESC